MPKERRQWFEQVLHFPGGFFADQFEFRPSLSQSPKNYACFTCLNVPSKSKMDFARILQRRKWTYFLYLLSFIDLMIRCNFALQRLIALWSLWWWHYLQFFFFFLILLYDVSQFLFSAAIYWPINVHYAQKSFVKQNSILYRRYYIVSVLHFYAIWMF